MSGLWIKLHDIRVRLDRPEYGLHINSPARIDRALANLFDAGEIIDPAPGSCDALALGSCDEWCDCPPGARRADAMQATP